MTTEQLIETFNPANASNLSPEDLSYLQRLTDDELGVLAKAYPNKATNNAYLIIYDSKVPDITKQMGTRYTFQNLFNLRVGNKQKNWYAFGFVSTQKQQAIPVAQPGRVQDLTKDDLAGLPGITSSSVQTGQTAPPEPAKEEAPEVVTKNEQGSNLTGMPGGQGNTPFTAFPLGHQNTNQEGSGASTDDQTGKEGTTTTTTEPPANEATSTPEEDKALQLDEAAQRAAKDLEDLAADLNHEEDGVEDEDDRNTTLNASLIGTPGTTLMPPLTDPTPGNEGAPDNTTTPTANQANTPQHPLRKRQLKRLQETKFLNFDKQNLKGVSNPLKEKL